MRFYKGKRLFINQANLKVTGLALLPLEMQIKTSYVCFHFNRNYAGVALAFCCCYSKISLCRFDTKSIGCKSFRYTCKVVSVHI